ncbi:hypothetical protein MUU72_22455 [Streptomyces sp. RS10V-4]|uniref:hypothetical protein n=1 Tax=Streptomyces rhizoryzae TaxID=2932493 RepID=UPI0020066713|nr:hypothetical protein [Streptomyces rhizoryzae]MCK7625829.1 hypothetical protein [Streptomyces rhizoryzae]
MTPAAPLHHAGAALAATVRHLRAHRGRGRPPVRVVTAVAGAHADLWACDRLARAAAGHEPAAAVARYLAPRLLLDAADGLAAAWAGPAPADPVEAAGYRHHVGRLAALAGAPGAAARLRAVAALVPALATGDGRLAQPLTVVPATVLKAPLGSLVRALEEERRAVLRAAPAVQPELPGGRGRLPDNDPALWALADRYALLALAAACLDGWRLPSPPPHSRPGDDRTCLTGALARTAAGLGLATGVTGRNWYGPVYALATAGPAGPKAGARAGFRPRASASPRA